MSRQEITLTISPSGEMQLEISGICGPTCQDIADPIQRALGVATAEIPTDEFFVDQAIGLEVSQ